MRRAWRYVFSLICLGVFVNLPQATAQETLPTPLAQIPADAIGFVHVPMADLWKSPIFKSIRETFDSADKDVLDQLEKQFNPSLSSLETIDLFLPGGVETLRGQPIPLVVLHFSKGIDKKQFLAAYFAKAKATQSVRGEFWDDPEFQLGFFFADEKTMIISQTATLKKYMSSEVTKKGPLAKSIQECASSKDYHMFVNLEIIPPQALASFGPFAPIAAAKQAHLQVSFKNDLGIKLELKYGSVKAREEADATIKQVIELGENYIADAKKKARAELFAPKKRDSKLEQMPQAYMMAYSLGALNQLGKLLKNPPIQREGNSIQVVVTVPEIYFEAGMGVGVLSGFMLPAVQKVRLAAGRSQSMNNLKQMILALWSMNDTYGKLPQAGAICDKKGKPLLSWRVAILPYIEQNNLYTQFKLDEPWDSEHNKKLIPFMPKTYRIPAAPQEEGKTFYRVFVGKHTIFELDKAKAMQSVQDGTSNTMMIFEAAESVIWTKPEEFEYDAKKPLPKMGNFYDAGFLISMMDGSVRMIPKTIKEKTLRALITVDGGEVIEDLDK